MLKLYGLSTFCNPNPTFSWKLEGNYDQKNYQLTIFNDDLVCVWDSGIVESANRHNIPCPVNLSTGEKYFWTISVWDTNGDCTTATGEHFFTPIEQWSAQWIEPNRIRKPLTDVVKPIHDVLEQEVPEEKLDPAISMRKTFALDALPQKAFLYATARGVYKLWINGTCVSDLLAPGFTAYAKHIDYQCYDVAAHLISGENVIDIVLTDGWFSGKIGALGIGQQFGKENAMLFQLDMVTDGNKHSICSDDDTLWTTSPWTYADLIVGEGYDARITCDDWKAPRICNYGYDTLTLQSTKPISVIRTLKPTLYYAPNGDLLLDAGETIAGYVSFTLDLAKDTKVSFEYTETLDAGGNFIRNIVGQNKNQTIAYTADKDGAHHYDPAFTFLGFRYVRIKGTADMNPEHYTVHVVGSPMNITGTFSCNDARLNQLQANIIRSQQGNMISIPTDCPQREKTGWTGDMQLYAPTAVYEMDVETFLRHWLADMAHDQRENGEIPHIIPYFPSHDVMRPPWISNDTSAGWSDAAVIVPWRLYEAYGDLCILENNFAMMKKYMDSVEGLVAEIPEKAKDFPHERKERMKYIWNTGFQYGDWLMPSMIRAGKSGLETAFATGDESSTLMYAYTTKLMAQVCRALGKEDFIAHYEELNTKIRQAFAEEFIKENGHLVREFQGLYVLALEMDAVPEHLKEKALARLEEMIHENNDLLDTGFLSVAFLLPVLHRNGLGKLANTLLFRDEAPSWLFEVKMGATTMWESWDSYDALGNPSTHSMNHFAFGCVGEYIFRTILGIDYVTPGYQTVRIAPDFECGLTDVSGSFDSIWGKIGVHWSNNGTTKTLEVVVPPNVTAIITTGNKDQTVGCGTYSFEF